eukprot:scaffold81_cov32-Attheya_sp.AAC.2
MSTPPSANTVDTVPSIVKGALTHTTYDPNVAYRPSKPTTLATAVASLVPTLATRFRPAPSVTHHAVPATLQDATTHTPPDLTVALDREGRKATEFEVDTVSLRAPSLSLSLSFGFGAAAAPSGGISNGSLN